MATFVICHGSFGGGWSWRAVADGLRRLGHHVFTPTLTGLGERVHLAHPGVDLSLHIRDIENVLIFEDLHDVVLVGHSYGGAVAAGVAERVPERLRQLIFIDALVPDSGQSVADLCPPEMVEYFKEAADAWGDGWQVPAPDAGDETRAVSQPIKTLTEPLVRQNPKAAALPQVFIACTRRSGLFAALEPAIERTAGRFRAEGRPCVQLAADHSPQREHPDEVVRVLLAAVEAGGGQ